MPISAKDRGAIYEIFASLYLNTINKNNIDNILQALQQIESTVKNIELTELIKVLERTKTEIKAGRKSFEELEQDYYDHFLVPQRGNYIPAYESFIAEAREVEDVLKKGKYKWKYNTSQDFIKYNLKAAYDSVGFNPLELSVVKQLSQQNKIDFLGFELAFMAYLNKSQAIAEARDQSSNSEKWFNLQSQFLKEHLSNFIGKYSRIANDKANLFYKNLSKVLSEFIENDIKGR